LLLLLRLLLSRQPALITTTKHTHGGRLRWLQLRRRRTEAPRLELRKVARILQVSLLVQLLYLLGREPLLEPRQAVRFVESRCLR
jgi:hypothetical protein